MTRPTTADNVVHTLDDEIERPILVQLLEQRWHKKLTLVEAPGGYGKTRALAQAMRVNEDDPVGVEFYVRCRSTHADPAQLTNAILHALGAPTERDPSPTTLPDRVVDELAAWSPTKVALILDDVHLIASSPDVVSLLATVLRELSTNVHLVLIGRAIPELPLARLRADDSVAEIAQRHLVFSRSEIALLAAHHGADPTALGELAGWPALLRLALVAGKAGPQNFLMQEIVDDLAPEIARGLTVVAVVGSADQDLLAAASISITVAELADRVPMLDVLASGEIRPHDVWSDLGQELAGPDELHEIVRLGTAWHVGNGRYDEAIMLAINHDEQALARSALMDALGSTDVSLRAELTRRWLDLFGGADVVADDDPDLLLLRGWNARLELGPGHGDEDVAAAVELFHERGDVRGEAHASVENAFRGYMAGDVGRIADSVQRGPRLVAAGMTFLDALGELTNAVIADINGDFEQALEHSMRAAGPDVRTEFAELALRHRATLQFIIGDSAAAIEATAQLVQLVPSPQNENTDLVARFAAGDIDELVERWDELRYQEFGNKRDDFIHGVKSIIIDASLGRTPSLEPIRSVAWERPRERFQQVLCEWHAAIIAGNETQANEELAKQISDLGLENPLIAGDVRRFLVPAYIAVPEARSYLEQVDAQDGFGPYQLRLLALARLLMAIRNDTRADWSGYVDPIHTISSLPLPWSVELACALVLHDEARGLELADALFAYAGARPQKWIRYLADSARPASAGADRLLAILPAPPQAPVVVRTAGAVSILSDGDERRVTRLRIRQLLLLLVLRGSVSRDVAMATLWPDKDLDNARNNLRITLSHLRADLEPGRRSGEPSFHLRQRGDHVVLRRSEHLQVDVWTILDALKTADGAARAGDRPAQLRALQVAAESWQPPLLRDLVDLEAVRSEVDALQARLAHATIEVAEACVSGGDYADAERLARKLLHNDPYNERAHAAVIAAHLGANQTAQAHQAIDTCLDVLTEIGVQPAPATRMLMRRAQYRDRADRRTA